MISIIDDIHSKGELQWTDEFARFLDQVGLLLLSSVTAIDILFFLQVCWCLEAHGGECTSATRGPDCGYDPGAVFARYLH